MDLMTCEAPLDNSFQKDRRELVNKGSLGRRRKPSRSNLKLILSPPADPQDIVVLNNSDSSSDIFQNSASSCHLNGSIQSNKQDIVKSEKYCEKTTSSYHLRCGNSDSYQNDVSGNIKENGTPFDHLNGSVQSSKQDTVTSGKYIEKNSSSYLRHDNSDSYPNDISGNIKENGAPSNHLNGSVQNNKQDPVTSGKYCGKTSIYHSRYDNSDSHQNNISGNIKESGTPSDHFNRIVDSNKREIATVKNCRTVNSTNQYQQGADYGNSIHHDNDVHGYTYSNGTYSDHLIENALNNQVEPAPSKQPHRKLSNPDPPKSVKYCDPQLTVASNNYQEVIASINKLRRVNGEDCNGNISVSKYHRNIAPSVDVENVINSRQQLNYRTDIKKVNTRCQPQVSVTRHLQSLGSSDNREKISNTKSSANTLNGSYNTVGIKHPVSDSKIHKALNDHNKDKSVTSRNSQNVITFSNHRQIITSTPIQTKKLNGLSSKNGHSTNLNIEPSLPRTSNKPNLVAEAQQFSVEAKLKRKKSEAQGRSAVLIQTWERRTLSDSFSKRKSSKSICLKNPETNYADAMPDSYICFKYKGGLQNGDHQEKGELIPSVRGTIPDETMLYRVPENTQGRTRQLPEKAPSNTVTTNGKPHSSQEPEWISLSKKLCAKFVEGHIEPHSPDSYLQEEPEGVQEETFPSPQPKIHSSDIHLTQRDVQKGKIVLSTPDEDESLDSNEPPWIHLSRKLCTKFIEEHIEYPHISNGHFVEAPELVEPNGDVRIIEKVGKPKGRKSKQKKECEPEWVSISKKLRAKFIESHIDDPDTISLDNQLNASDPEETSSESLSDVPQDTVAPPKRTTTHSDVRVNKDTTRRQYEKQIVAHTENTSRLINNNSVIFPEKECCWEYQEMEFDQESNSGTFQEMEYFDEPLQEARIRRGFLPEDGTDDFTVRESVSYDKRSIDFQTPECFNNDVQFAPRITTDDNPERKQNKLITVQIITHADNIANNRRRDFEIEDDLQNSKKGAIHGSFFNLSTWEEAHNQQENKIVINTKNESLRSDLKSKSLDNLYDSLEDRLSTDEDNCRRKDKICTHGKISKENSASHYEELVNNDDGGIFFEEFEPEPLISSKASSVNENIGDNSQELHSESETTKIVPNQFRCQENKQNFVHKTRNSESSDDEVFGFKPTNPNYSSNVNQYGKISPQKSPIIEKEQQNKQQKNNEKVENDSLKPSDKNFKCNGMIPNSIYSGLPENKTSFSKQNQNEKSAQNGRKEPVKLGMSKWITISKSEQNVSRNEYSNLPSNSQKCKKNVSKSSNNNNDPKEIKLKKTHFEKRYIEENKSAASVKDNVSQKNIEKKNKNDYLYTLNGVDSNSNMFDGSVKEFDLKHKCKSLCDISYNMDSCQDDSLQHHASVADLASVSHKAKSPQVEFQHFAFESEIPLCAKLVSKQDRKRSSTNIHSTSPSNRTESPCPSESSHVYEDMFKETPSGPSDSEASSWTAMKYNSYYVNGRSSSMNDLDYSDSCSMSVKCDYASSSENSTLQSRHSSYASSSFYVNLRDYDSHMLEPSSDKTKRSNGKILSNGNSSSLSKSNPPTPESLRHLFTSPLSSIHSPPNRTARLINRMPSDPQSHYYSTAAATSSAFKHGFAAVPPKPKKTERSSSIKIKDIAHGIILTFKKLHNHSKNSNVSPTHYVDVSHLAEMNSNGNPESGGKSKKSQKDSKKQSQDKGHWTENGKTDTDSGFLSDVQRAKARRSSSDLTDMKSKPDIMNQDKKKRKADKKNSNREKGKKTRSKISEPRTIPTVSRKVQKMADGTLYLVTTVSGDTTMPGVYSDSPDTSSELSTHQPVRQTGESNC